MRVLFYQACLLLLTVCAFRWGGRPERLGTLILVIGSLLTLAAYSPSARLFVGVELGVLAVDLAALAAFLALALYTDRHWPVWTTALQLVGTLAHLAKMADLAMPRNGYGFLLAIWAYPIMLTIAVGIWRHHRSVRSHASS